MQVVAMIFVLVAPAMANTLDSTNYKVEDFNFNNGGGRSTSTVYALDSNIEIVLDSFTTPAPPPPPPPTPPSISNVHVINIAATSATVVWETSENANSIVEYGLDTSYGSSSSSPVNVMSHSIGLSGLAENTLYHFRVRSGNAINGQGVSGDYTFTTASIVPPPPPPPPLAISNVQALNVTASSAIITWSTNILADSFTEYGLTLGYEIGSVSSSSLATSHSLDLSGLTAGTLYHFRVKSKDASNNQVTSGDYTFTTTSLAPPVISNIRVIDITGTSARVLWDTDRTATSVVNYGLETSYGSVANDSNLVTAHQIDLTGLASQTVYHFQITSVGGNGVSASSVDQVFTTLDITPPVISNVQIINITERKADITWVTNEAASSRIFYRRVGDTAYSEAADGAFQVSHFMTLNNLIANVDYEFYIVATDSSGNFAQSTNYTFRTLPDRIPPTNIRNFTATPDDKLNVLTWQNPIDPYYAGVMIVRSTSTFPRNRFEGDIIYVGLGVSHNDTGLINGVTYFYTGFAFDTSNNFASGAVTQGTPFGPEQPPPPPPPPPPTVTPTINLDAVSFWVASRTIKVNPDANGIVEMLAGVGMGISVDTAKVPSDTKLITLRVENSNYLLKLRADGSAYDTDITLPPTSAIFPAEITFVFEKDQQVVKFSFDLRSKGMIFEKKDDAVVPVENAVIILYEFYNNNWRIWPSANFYQINPLITRADGLYGFVVPNGTYYLDVKKDGYRDVNTNRFTVTRNYINQSLELLAKPKPIQEVINPEAPLSENVAAVVQNIGEQTVYNAKVATENVVQFAQNPLVEQATSNIAAPSLISIAVVNAAAAIPMLNLWTYLQYLLTQPFLFFQRKKRKAWGIIYNAYTKMPLDLAVVRLLDAKTRRIVRTLVTDKQGRYVLFAPQGEFILTVTKAGFQFPSAYLKGRKEDEAYVDLYFGEKFEVKQEGQAIIYNIPMDPLEAKVSLRRMIVKRALKGLQFGLALSGIVLTTAALIIAPSIKLGLFLALHIAIFTLFIRLARPARFKKWGMARDAKTGKPIKNAVVRLFEPEYNKLLGTQITDAKGRYAFLVGRNIYYVTFEKAGFKTLKTKNIDTRTKSREGVITEKVKMEEE